MIELELSIMSHGGHPVADLKKLLKPFENEHLVQVNIKPMTWETAWGDLVKDALYSQGPDVSEIGTTWIGSLVAMNVLRPFDPETISQIGDAVAFLDVAWRRGSLIGHGQMWAIPWLADLRMVYYRRDLLEKAGIDEYTAFQSIENFEETLARLQASGVMIPLVLPTRQTPGTLHNLASWIWSYGGDFISPEGQELLFTRPEALAGIKAYFGLYRYLAPAVRDLDFNECNQIFAEGNAAIVISGSWLLQLLSPSVAANLGIAFPPGPPFVGGTSLVIWQHADKKGSAELVRYLTGDQMQSSYPYYVGLMPVRLDVLTQPPFSDHPLYRLLSEGLRVGRSFPPHPAWGPIEDKLVIGLAHMWKDVLSVPQPDLDAIINRHIHPLAKRLAITLANSRAMQQAP